MKIVQYIQAELIKLKYLPIMWLSGVVVFTVSVIVFAAHFLDINSVAELGKNPWNKIHFAGRAMYGVFIATPFVVLLVSAALYLEHHSNMFKYQYTVPSNRAYIFFSKVISILLVILFTSLLFIIGLTVCGYILDFFLPEMEFRYYNPLNTEAIKMLLHLFVALLGIVGIQLFLSFYFKGFLVPAGFGVVAFIVGLILGGSDSPLALYFPYSYPIIVKDFGMFRYEKIKIIEYSILNNVQFHSLGWFVIMILTTTIFETKKNIT